MNKIKDKLQELGMDTIDVNVHMGFTPDGTDHQIAAEILSTLHIKKVKLLTNNPDKIIGLQRNGIQVVKRIPLIIQPNPFNIAYLDTKKTCMGHLLSEGEFEIQYYDN